ncbi:MAG: hypothetical protein AMXMBFR82_12200 [Candidatus Hydrogenedentota bacterium]
MNNLEQPPDLSTLPDHPGHVEDLSSVDRAWRLPFRAGVLVFAAVAGMLFWHHDRGIAAGVWQGWAAPGHGVYDRPLLSTWMAETCRALAPGTLLDLLHTVNLLLGALSAALVASLTVNLTAERMPSLERVLCGCVAGLLFSCATVWRTTLTGFSPATITVALALTAFFVVCRPARPLRLPALFVAALLIGLASANDPVFGVAGLILAVLAIHSAAARSSAWVIILTYAVGFVAGAGLPIWNSLVAGEGRAEFLAHALATPYPTLGDGTPAFGFLARLNDEFVWPILAVSLVGLIVAIGQRHVGLALGWTFVFLAMGPFLPALTNQKRTPVVLTDSSAAQAMVAASVALFAAWGLVGMARILLPKEAQLPRRVGIVAVLGLALIALQWTRYTPESPETTSALAEAVLADCPPESVLITGDARIHTLIETVQVTRAIRPDVTIVSADALSSPRHRSRLNAIAGAKLNIDSVFPPIDALNRWAMERPQALAALNHSAGSRSDLRDLAIWELMCDNFSKRPFAFVGVSAPWLTARVQRNGVVLVFPRDGMVQRHSLDRIDDYAGDLDDSAGNAELRQTVAAMLLPLSEASRRQGDIRTATHTAELARRIRGDDAVPWLASARAAARAGDREQAIVYVEQYLLNMPGPDPVGDLGDAIQEDLTRNALAEAFVSSMGGELPAANPNVQKRLIEDLWEFEELQVLADGYRIAREAHVARGDVEALCESAAVLTQLGELAAAREELGVAVAINPIRVWRRLKNDPRFDLLRMETSESDAMAG